MPPTRHPLRLQLAATTPRGDLVTLYFRGKRSCPCLIAWLPAYERELRARGVLARKPKAFLSIYQLIGTAAASAGTHTGGAFDITDLPGDIDLWVARQMGADATWLRPRNWDGRGGIEHTHGVLRGCPHNTGGRYQIAAVDAGFNGLGAGGRGGPDTGPRPLSGRTWEEGVAWHREQQRIRRVASFNAKIRQAREAKDQLTEQKSKLTERIKVWRDKRDAA
jgi:hypothetical protein